MSDSNRVLVRKLVVLYREERISSDEMDLLWGLLRDPSCSEYFDEVLKELSALEEERSTVILDSDRMYRTILARMNNEDGAYNVPTSHKSNKFRVFVLSSAAILIFGLLTLSYFYLPPFRTSSFSDDFVAVRYDAAEFDGVELVTSGGEVVGLDYSMGEYSVDNSIGANAVTEGVNLLRTSDRHTYKLSLGDGTVVWLNSNTEVHFPTTFSDEYRQITIVGEALVEVSRRSRPSGEGTHWPFRVVAGDQLIEVKGTVFNVCAYQEDQFNAVTLVEGKVSVALKENRVDLTPGMQLLTKGDGVWNKVKEVDTEEVLQWKSGFFYFNEEALLRVVDRLSRWYGVDFKVENSVKNKMIGGAVPKADRVEDVLDALQATGLFHYHEEGGLYRIMK